MENERDHDEGEEERELPPMVGGLMDVEVGSGNRNDMEIEGLAKFAVDEHNQKQNAMLEFKRVVKAKVQVVAGLMHYLTIEVADGDKTKLYKAKVWTQAWMDWKGVQEFQEVAEGESDDPADCPGGACGRRG